MKLKYLLKKTINIRTSYLIAIVIAAILIIGGCFSYAVFTVRSESKGALNIVTGNLYPYLESADLDKEKKIIVNPNDSVIIAVKLMNVNGIEVKANMYYSATSKNVDVKYLSKADAAPQKTGVILGAHGSETDSQNIDIKITNNDSISPVTITFGSDVGLKQSDLTFPEDKNQILKFEGNPYIIRAYNYNDDVAADNYCLTGEETSCVISDCYNNKEVNSCVPGTIFKYKVADNIEKTFYVIEDKGTSITLQQRENTITNFAWYADADDNSHGPTTVLAQLKEETKNWDNVLDQTYTMGTTPFKDNSFTGCSSYDTCSTNAYTLTETNAKARMITAQEAKALSCTDSEKSCPKWMYNYLYASTNYDGTAEDNMPTNNRFNIGYWTMSAYTTIPGSAMHITNSGALTGANGLTTSLYGARAVIDIKK